MLSTPEPTPTAGALVDLKIGQHVRLREAYKGKRVSGRVRGLCIEESNALMATIALDEPIVIPANPEYPQDREIRLHTQHLPAHELVAFDERDEVLVQAAVFTQSVERFLRHEGDGHLPPTESELAAALYALRAAISKVAA